MEDLAEYRLAVAKSFDNLFLSSAELRKFYDRNAKNLFPEFDDALDDMAHVLALLEDHLMHNALENMNEDELIYYGQIISKLNRESLSIKDTLARLIL